jgi:hypothetical protein
MFSCFHNTEYKDKRPASIEGSRKYVPDGIILDGPYAYLSREVL